MPSPLLLPDDSDEITQGQDPETSLGWAGHWLGRSSALRPPGAYVDRARERPRDRPPSGTDVTRTTLSRPVD